MGGYFYDYDGTKTRPNQETKGEPLAFFSPTKKSTDWSVRGWDHQIVIAQ